MLNNYVVPVWISGVYEFNVEAETVEEAIEIVVTGVVPISYSDLEKQVSWDYGYVDPTDVVVAENTTDHSQPQLPLEWDNVYTKD
jgi:hypothetical protein